MTRHWASVFLKMMDGLIIVGSVIAAYLLRFDFPVPAPYSNVIPYVVCIYAAALFGFFHYTKVYRKAWAYAGIEDIVFIIKMIAAGCLVAFIGVSIVNYSLPSFIVPRSIHILAFIVASVTICCVRIVLHAVHNASEKLQSHHQRALIVGAGQAGSLVVKQLMQTKYKAAYFPIAFADDDPRKQNMEILGVPVAGTTMDIPDIVKKMKIPVIVIALPSARKEQLSQIIEICKSTGCQLKTMPALNDLIHGKIHLNTIRNVSVEDLLGRETIRLDIGQIESDVAGKVVMVSGAGGSIGSELCRQLCAFSPGKLILLGRGENSIYEIELELKNRFPGVEIEPVIADVQDKRRMDAIFYACRPQLVFHAAAHKHVPMMEKNPGEAIKNNIFGTRTIAMCAHKYKCERFVLISTDKAVNPTNVMGATKRVAEMVVQSMDQRSATRFSAVRFGNVLGSRGSVIPLFKKQIEAGGPVTVTHPDMVRYFMTIPEAVQLVIQACALSGGGEVFVLDMGRPVKIVDLARELIALSGFEPDRDIKIEFSGMRPGEKLYEELLSPEEISGATRHDRIFIGKAHPPEWETLGDQLDKLEGMMLQGGARLPGLELKRVLRQLVPTYRFETDISSGATAPKAQDNLVFLDPSDIRQRGRKG